MCYDPCGDGQTGSHNVCWGQCPKGTEQCGVLCLGHGEKCTSYLSSIGKETLTSVLAQEHQRGQGQMSNDLELAEIQEETLNNQILKRVLAESEDHHQILSMGRDLSFPICSTFA